MALIPSTSVFTPVKVVSQVVNEADNKVKKPLIEQADLLSKAIIEKCMERVELVDLHRPSRTALKVVCITLSGVSKLTYLPLALKMSGGPFWAAGSCLGYLALDYWAIGGSINETLAPRAPSEILLLQNTGSGRGRKYVVATIISSIVLGIIARIPLSLPSLDYNTGALKWGGFFLVLLGGSFTTIRSIHMTIDKIYQACRKLALDQLGKELEKARGKMIALLTRNRTVFRQMKISEQSPIIQLLTTARTSRLANAEDNYFLEVFKELQQEPEKSCGEQVRDNFGYVIGLVLSGIYQKVIGEYTFEKSKQYITGDDEEVAAGFISGAVVAAGSVIITGAIVNLSQRVYKFALDRLLGRKEKTLADQLRPKLVLSLQILSLITDIAATGISWKIWTDFYENDLNDDLAKSRFHEISACAATFLFLLTGSIELVDQFIEELLRRKGTLLEKDIVTISDELEQMKNLIQHSSFVDFSIFASNLPPQLKSTFKITVQRIETNFGLLRDATQRALTPAK